MAIKISVAGVSMAFPASLRASLEKVSFEVAEGEVVCVVGPSGCGKTTLLRILAGVESPTGGEVSRRAGRADRPFACMVYQDLALFPWQTVLQNAALGPRLRGIPADQAATIAKECLRQARLTGVDGYYPHQLSGGMKQRLALARALASEAEVLLLDEPLGALDAATRRLLQDELQGLFRERGTTAVMVTHDIEEALLLGDRIVVMTAGPGRVKAILESPLPRPRTPEIRAAPEFAAAAGRLWSLLQEEVARSL
jgi:NitT/TauT family transport system ATP-binding protein